MTDEHNRLFEDDYYQDKPETEPPRLYRRTDPSSSRRHSDWLHKSGRLSEHQSRALRQVRERPGLTSAQYAGDDYKWLQQLRRALPILHKRGLVRRVEREKGDLLWFPREESSQ